MGLFDAIRGESSSPSGSIFDGIDEIELQRHRDWVPIRRRISDEERKKKEQEKFEADRVKRLNRTAFGRDDPIKGATTTPRGEKVPLRKAFTDPISESFMGRASRQIAIGAPGVGSKAQLDRQVKRGEIRQESANDLLAQLLIEAGITPDMSNLEIAKRVGADIGSVGALALSGGTVGGRAAVPGGINKMGTAMQSGRLAKGAFVPKGVAGVVKQSGFEAGLGALFGALEATGQQGGIKDVSKRAAQYGAVSAFIPPALTGAGKGISKLRRGVTSARGSVARSAEAVPDMVDDDLISALTREELGSGVPRLNAPASRGAGTGVMRDSAADPSLLAELQKVERQIRNAQTKGGVSADEGRALMREREALIEEIQSSKPKITTAERTAKAAPQATEHPLEERFESTFEFGKGAIRASRKDVKEIAKDTAQKTAEEMLDKHSPLVRLVRNFTKKTGQNLEGLDDPVVAIRLAAGVGAQVDQKASELTKIVSRLPQKGMVDDVARLGFSRRILNNRPEIRTPGQLATAQNTVNDVTSKYSKGQLAEIERAIKDINDYSASLLDLKAKEGIITRELADKLKRENPDYFSRIEILEKINEGKPLTPRSFSVRKSGVERQKGFGDDVTVLDPYAALFRETVRTHQAVAKNRVGKALSNLDDGVLVRHVKESTKPRKGMAKIAYREDGKTKFLEVPEEIGNMLQGLNQQQRDAITGFMGRTGKILRMSATTLRPIFVFVRNPIRDFKSFLINSRTVPVHRAAQEWASAFVDGLLGREAAQEFIKRGGGQSGFIFQQDVKSAEKYARQLRSSAGRASPATIVKKPYQLYQKLGEAFENAPRIAEFKGGLKQGIDADTATVYGREVTVDFAQSGNVGQQLNLWVPFLNARTQGTKRLITAFREDPVRAGAVYMTTTALPAAALAYSNLKNFSHVWNDLQEYEKDGYFIWIMGDEQDKNGRYTNIIKIPKSDIDLALGNPVQRAIEDLFLNNPTDLVGTAVDTLSDISPTDFARGGRISGSKIASSLLPPAVKGLVEDAANHNFFFDSPVVPEYMEGLPPKEQRYPSDSRLARVLGSLTDVSPRRAENFIGSTFGPTPSEVSQPADILKTFDKTLSSARGGAKTNEFFNIRKEIAPEQKQVSRKITSLIKEDKEDEARKVADEFNAKIEKKFENYMKTHGDVPEELRDYYTALYFNLNDRSMAARRRQ